MTQTNEHLHAHVCKLADRVATLGRKELGTVERIRLACGHICAVLETAVVAEVARREGVAVK